MAFTVDLLRTKTDAELRFYVENPRFYQSELVASARQELRRRGLATAVFVGPAAYPDSEATPQSRPLLLALASLAFTVAAVGFWSWQSQPLQAASEAQAARPNQARPSLIPAAPASPKLLEADTHPVPHFDSQRRAAQELATLPAAEQANELKRSQFEELSRRFWQGQLPSAYLEQQADSVTAYAPFANQLQAAQHEWYYLNQALLYRYNLPPAMADHLQRMRSISHLQQAALQGMQQSCLAQLPVRLASEAQLAQDTVQCLLAGMQ
ncbi:MAG: hypothetical protein ACRYFX_28830 [Janthinobacterium lividum]